MTSAQPLQLQQLQLFLEDFPQGLVSLWEFLSIQKSTFVRSDSDVGKESSSDSSKKRSVGLRSGLWASPVFPHQTHSYMLLWTLPCTLVHSHVGTGRGPSPSCSDKGRSVTLSKMSPFTLFFLLRGRIHLLKPPQPNFTRGTMQSDKYGSPGNHKTQTQPSDCQAKRDLLRLHCSRVQ